MTLQKFFASTSIFFKYFDRHPYVNYEGQEVMIPLSSELKGIDAFNLTGRADYMVKVSADETQLILSDILDGGEF